MYRFFKYNFYFLALNIVFHISSVFAGEPLGSKGSNSSKSNVSENKTSSSNDLEQTNQNILTALEGIKTLISNYKTTDKETMQNKTDIGLIRKFVTEKFATNDALNNHIHSTNTRFTNIENTYATKTWTENSIKDEIAKLEENIAKNRLNKQDQKIADLEGLLTQKNDSLNIPNNVLTDEMKKYINQRVDEMAYKHDVRLSKLEKDKDNSNFFTADSTWEFAKQNKTNIASTTFLIAWGLSKAYEQGWYTAVGALLAKGLGFGSQ